jgi:hypothetical protein
MRLIQAHFLCSVLKLKEKENRMNVQATFTVRIRTEQEQDMDWMVQPDQISFHQALVRFFSSMETVNTFTSPRFLCRLTALIKLL